MHLLIFRDLISHNLIWVKIFLSMEIRVLQMDFVFL